MISRMRCFNPLGAKSAAGANPAVVAQKDAADGVAEMIRGYRKVAQLSLPPGAALVFARLRNQLAELESLVGNAAPAESRPWRLPLPEEQSEWEQAYKSGGILLRRQLCSASTDRGEWFIGGLFISDAGIVFDTGSSSDNTARFNTGFLPWKAIESVERTGGDSEVSMVLSEGVADSTRLYVQLTIATDTEWLEEFWRLCKEPATKTVVPASVAPAAGEAKKGAEEQASGPAVLLQQLSKSVSKALGVGEATPEGNSPRAHRQASLDSQVSTQYDQGPNGRPSYEVPEKEAPVGTTTITGIDLDAAMAKLRDEDWFCKAVLRDNKGATNIEATPWTESKQSPGVLVRKGTFTVPVPQDFPRAVTRIVNLPLETKCTAVFRLHPQTDRVVFTIQMCSHDIPFGDNFRNHETVILKPGANGGVDATMYVEVMWIAALPWTMSVLKGVIESKSKADGLGTRLVNSVKKDVAQ